MPHKQQHRGAHPSDASSFAEKHWPALRAAVSDVSWLMSRGYTADAGIKLAGDHYRLRGRQRNAVLRCTCTERNNDARRLKKSPAVDLSGKKLLIDGFNLLITIEAALSGGLILEGMDGCYRDLARVHGSYRKVEETIPALLLIGRFLQKKKAGPVVWVLDKPVSNSGSLSRLILETAEANNWPWSVELHRKADDVLKAAEDFVASSDSVVLDEVKRWVNLAREIIEAEIPEAWVIRLAGEEEAGR